MAERADFKLLNAFFDLVVPGVVAGGGDVLKYIGDAVIAIFPVAGDDPAPACELALAAARTALAALQGAPPEIQQHISIDIALHYGVAAYGNIGSGNRLDFSVVGRDVNILSRLELLCKDVGRALLMTDAFAVEVAEPVFEIGHFELRVRYTVVAAARRCLPRQPLPTSHRPSNVRADACFNQWKLHDGRRANGQGQDAH